MRIEHLFVNLLGEEKFLLPSDAEDLDKRVIDEVREYLKDAQIVSMRSMINVFHKFMVDCDTKDKNPFNQGALSNFYHTSEGLGIPKDKLEVGIRALGLATYFLSDACWLSKPSLLAIKDREIERKSFRCFKVLGNTYLYVASIYDLVLEKEDGYGIIYETVLIRPLDIFGFLSGMLRALLYEGGRGMKEYFEEIDDLINAARMVERRVMENLNSVINMLEKGEGPHYLQ